MLLALCAGAVEYDLQIKTDKPHWAVKAGEKVTFSFQLLSRADKNAPFQVVKGRKVTYEIMGDGGMANEKKLFVTTDKPFTLTHTLNGPGWLCVNFIVREDNSKPTYIQKNGKKIMLEKGIGVLFDRRAIHGSTKNVCKLSS